MRRQMAFISWELPPRNSQDIAAITIKRVALSGVCFMLTSFMVAK